MLLFCDHAPERGTGTINGKEDDSDAQVDELTTILALFVEREKVAKQGESSDLAERAR